jgi:hypothetical protein
VSWSLQLWSERSSDSVILAEVWPTVTTPESGVVTEGGTYWWRLVGADVDAFRTELKVNGLPLARDAESASEVWFAWTLGFNSGSADIEVRGIRPASGKSMQVVVDPHRAKLTRQHFRMMLKDIVEDTRSLAATSGLRQGVSTGPKDLPIATIEYLLSHSRTLKAAVVELDAAHRKRLVRRTETVPLQRARRLTGRDWNLSSRTAREIPIADVMRLPRPIRDVVRQAGNRMPVRITQSAVVMDSARREHSEVLGLLHEILGLLANVRAAQMKLRPEERDNVLLLRCGKMALQVRESLAYPVFTKVEPARGSWSFSHLYERVEPYRSLYRIHRDIRRGISGVDGDFASVPLRETYRLYETWVSLRLVRAVKLLDPSLSTRVMFDDRKDPNRLTFSLAATDVAFDGRLLRFKPVFNESWKSSDGVGSYTRQMIPDIVIEFRRKGPGPRKLIVLDAKYRVDAQLNDAITSIHTYRDALIAEARPPSQGTDEEIVVAGFVVVPQMPDGSMEPADWRDQSAPYVLFRRGYQNRFNLGAIVLKPGIGIPTIAEMIKDLLQRFP